VVLSARLPAAPFVGAAPACGTPACCISGPLLKIKPLAGTTRAAKSRTALIGQLAGTQPSAGRFDNTRPCSGGFRVSWFRNALAGRINSPNPCKGSDMDKAELTMLENMKEKTGHSLDEWKKLIAKQSFSKHGEIVKFLKEQHSVTHGYASEIALKVLASDAASADDSESLIESQYKGKEHLKPFYDAIIAAVEKFGGDFKIDPKKAYVSLKRKKQFITLTPASKTRFEIGFNLKGTEPQGKLEAEKPNGICSHKINLAAVTDIDKEVIGWIKVAFDKAG
jgi:predicted transport protein